MFSGRVVLPKALARSDQKAQPTAVNSQPQCFASCKQPREYEPHRILLTASPLHCFIPTTVTIHPPAFFIGLVSLLWVSRDSAPYHIVLCVLRSVSLSAPPLPDALLLKHDNPCLAIGRKVLSACDSHGLLLPPAILPLLRQMSAVRVNIDLASLCYVYISYSLLCVCICTPFTHTIKSTSFQKRLVPSARFSYFQPFHLSTLH